MNAETVTTATGCAQNNNHKNKQVVSVKLFTFVGFFPGTFPLPLTSQFTNL